MLEHPGEAEHELSGVERRENGGASGGSLLEEGETSGSGAGGGGGNRWPQEETLALLKVRSDMDAAFRDSSVKAPLWDEISRKLSDLGYHRSAKKCKEKFENIYKYHKRTKGQYARTNGKAYRFYDQLEAFDHNDFSLPSVVPEQATASSDVTPVSYALPQNVPHLQIPVPSSVQHFDSSRAFTVSSSEEEDDNEDDQRRKRKWESFFSRVLKTVLEKQEDLQNKLLDTLDRCERERIAREEAWKAQELARIKRQQELLDRERSIAAAKDAAVIAFLQKISEQGTSSSEQCKSLVQAWGNPCAEDKSILDMDSGNDNGNGNANVNLNVNVERTLHSGSSRWPKEEVETLIRIRANMEHEHQDSSGSKAVSLWEEISSAMRKLGYSRSAKRCKEKWENINKYFRRVKDSNKKRPADSKACAYFQQLEALYSSKSKKSRNNPETDAGGNLRPEELLMHMMNHQQELEEEQQQISPQGEGPLPVDEDTGEDMHQNRVGDGEREEEEDYERGEFQIVCSDTSSRKTMD